MKIEIAEPGRMTQSGSSLLKLIQNNDMPVLDLLVRESIQNSLDARKKDSRYVDVKFLVDNFKAYDLNEKLEGITNKLNHKYGDKTYKYIAIQDRNTVGLTGKLHYSEVKDNNYGNLLKLIYEISKPQDAAGAGGSWGLGKTVYFRVGVGLVFYYSRIIDENGQYASRLAASLVEDEHDPKALLPAYNGLSKRGIAWWGQQIGENKTKPLTDEEEIEDVLQVFHITPYEGEVTGTTIIIPYIDENVLLNANMIDYGDDNQSYIPPWRTSIEQYLIKSIQRWYAPRLNNSHYEYGSFLRATVNDYKITKSNMDPIFRIFRDLYNIAKGITEDEIFINDRNRIHSEAIIVRKFFDDQLAGNVAFVKVNAEILEMLPPNNRPNPYVYTNCEMKSLDKNKPIVCVTRQPGMIVQYYNIGNWADGIPETTNDEYILALFVLNSNNKFKNSDITLEEYIRKGEMADHTDWFDYPFNNQNYRIVQKIRTNMITKIKKIYEVKDNIQNVKVRVGLGKEMGKLLLPTRDFGKAASGKSKEGTETKKKSASSSSHSSLKVDTESMIYGKDTVEISVRMVVKKNILMTGFLLCVDSESGAIAPGEWTKKYGLSMPFEINSIEYINQKTEKTVYLDRNNKSHFVTKFATVHLLQDKIYNQIIGVKISTDGSKKFEVEFKVTLKIKEKDEIPVFKRIKEK